MQSKSAQFYFVRIVLGFICTLCEIRLYSVISRTLNPRAGVLFLLPVLFSPGMFHASTALLPSSFTMYTSMLGLAAFMDWRNKASIARGIMWFGIGSIIGWPFSGALMIPFIIEEFTVAFMSNATPSFIYNCLDGGIRCLVALVRSNSEGYSTQYHTNHITYQAFEVLVDSLFYRKLVVVPWNIVSYNVFGGSGKGPEIFGVEPWTFYFKNLLLNFNIWFILALAVAPLLVLQALFRSHTTSKQTLLRSVTFVLPFYVWFGIFTLQPHKEERFMYPAYPFLAFNAAIAFHIVLSYIGSSNPGELIGRIPPNVKFAAVMTLLLASVNIGLLRSLGLVTAYKAPLQVLPSLEKIYQTGHGASVCFGKEWYRFPSSYFLPDGYKAKFIKSEFNGLLPGEFPEDVVDQSWRPGTWMKPPGMNDRNEEDLDKYVRQHNF